MIRCMTLIDLVRILRGDSLRECASALGLARTTLLANVEGERFLLAHEVKALAEKVRSYAEEAGVFGPIVSAFVEGYAFEARLRDSLGRMGAFEAAASCAESILKSYLAGEPSFSAEKARTFLEAVFSDGEFRELREPADISFAEYLLWRLKGRMRREDWDSKIQPAVVHLSPGVAYDVLMSLARRTAVVFECSSGRARVECETIAGGAVSSEFGFDPSRHVRYGFRITGGTG